MNMKTLPAALPGGALLPYMSAQRFNQLAWTTFEAIGGFERLAHEADKDFKWFMEKVFVKAQPKNLNVDATSSTGIEGLLAKAKQAQEEGILDITPREVADAD